MLVVCAVLSPLLVGPKNIHWHATFEYYIVGVVSSKTIIKTLCFQNHLQSFDLQEVVKMWISFIVPIQMMKRNQIPKTASGKSSKLSGAGRAFKKFTLPTNFSFTVFAEASTKLFRIFLFFNF